MFPLIAKSILSVPPPERSVMEMNAWNPDDASPNIVVLDDDALTCRRLPSVSNDFIVECIRGKIGYTTGYHIWQIKWTNCGEADTVVVGVATSSAELHDVDSVIGSTPDSFGWDLSE
jgi:SPRY domain-containing SOCS box protein 1/4